MIIKQLWSNCRLRIVFSKRVAIEIQLFMGWKALTVHKIIPTLGFLLVFGWGRFKEILV